MLEVIHTMVPLLEDWLEAVEAASDIATEFPKDDKLTEHVRQKASDIAAALAEGYTVIREAEGGAA